MPTRCTGYAWALVALMLLIQAGTAQAFLTTELVASGLNRPIYVTAPEGDARLFIIEQRGTIQILKDGSILPEPFLDIDAIVANVSGFSEQGLLGLAFHPDYDANSYFFVHYTNTGGSTVIARYEREEFDPDKADASSAEIVLTQSQPFGNHNGGTIEFGPDGYLYFGFGDGGGSGDAGNRAQDPLTLLGKFIRIDVDPLPYTSPLTNPYVGDPNVLDEIWARGVRNPYRWSFDRETGDLWIADVGQGLWEEIDFQPATSTGRENYGWRLMEGLHCFNPPANCGSDTLDLPIHEYSHAGGNCSVTGGYVYRGAAIPVLDGYYLFGDYCSNRIWALEYDGNTVTTFLELTEFLNPGGQIGGLAAIGEDGAGELYLVDRDGTTSGEVYRIVADPAGIDEGGDLGPTFRLGPPRPNPSSAGSAVDLTLAQPARISARVYNAAGKPVRQLLAGSRAEGIHRIEWDGRGRDGGATCVRMDEERHPLVARESQECVVEEGPHEVPQSHAGKHVRRVVSPTLHTRPPGAKVEGCEPPPRGSASRLRHLQKLDVPRCQHRIDRSTRRVRRREALAIRPVRTQPIGCVLQAHRDLVIDENGSRADTDAPELVGGPPFLVVSCGSRHDCHEIRGEGGAVKDRARVARALCGAEDGGVLHRPVRDLPVGIVDLECKSGPGRDPRRGIQGRGLRRSSEAIPSWGDRGVLAPSLPVREPASAPGQSEEKQEQEYGAQLPGARREVCHFTSYTRYFPPSVTQYSSPATPRSPSRIAARLRATM